LVDVKEADPGTIAQLDAPAGFAEAGIGG